MPGTEPDVHTGAEPAAALDLAIGQFETPQADPGEWNPITCQSVYCF